MVKRIQIQERDHTILEHIDRYRMTTTDVLHSLFFDGKAKDAVRSTLRRLQGAEYISSASLAPPRRCYYHLASRGARLLGVSQSHADALGEQALPTRYAVLSFCCSGKERKVLRTGEFAEEFPDCVYKGLPNEPYYYDDATGVPRLSYIMVDLGADAGRIIRKCRRVFGERLKIKAFHELIKDDAFSVTLLTSRESKKKAIDAARKRASDFPYPIRVETVSELMGVI